MPTSARVIGFALHDDTLIAMVETAVLGLGCVTQAISLTLDTVIAALVQWQPSLLVLTLERDPKAVLHCITAAKTNPATRKIPLLVIADGDPAPILQAGANAVVTRAVFLADPALALKQHARPDNSAELLRQAQLPLPTLAHTAIEQFNAGEFFEQHETFEALWRAEPGPIRQLYQGLLQVGVAYLQIQRANYDGARKLFLRATQYLQMLPDVCQGVDIAQFCADAQAAQAALEALGPGRIAEFPSYLFQSIVMYPSNVHSLNI